MATTTKIKKRKHDDDDNHNHSSKRHHHHHTNKKDKVTVDLGWTPPLKYMTEPFPWCIFLVDTTGRVQTKNWKGHMVVSVAELKHQDDIPFPTSIDVKNNHTNLRQANKIRWLIQQGFTARAFKRETSLVLAFGPHNHEDQQKIDDDVKPSTVEPPPQQPSNIEQPPCSNSTWEKRKEIFCQMAPKCKTMTSAEIEKFIDDIDMRPLWEYEKQNAIRDALWKTVFFSGTNKYRTSVNMFYLNDLK